MDEIAELEAEIERIEERLERLDYWADQCSADLELDALEGIAEEEDSLDEDLRIYADLLERARARSGAKT